jgi:hypothetical protein
MTLIDNPRSGELKMLSLLEMTESRRRLAFLCLLSFVALC